MRHPVSAPCAPTPAAALARQIARLEALRSENEADWRPSFVALLERMAPHQAEPERKAA